MLAAHHGIPFYVAAPRSTFDFNMANGAAIPIEERAAEEVASFGGARVAPDGAAVYNPAFDVTPGHLITAFITEYGILRPPYAESIGESGAASLKYYDFLDKSPAIGRLVIIEGTERELADRALEIVLDRTLPPDVRELNLARFMPEDVGEPSRIREAVEAMPFLAERRVVVVDDAQTLRADPRRELWEVAQEAPEGNTLVIVDLLSPRSQRPQPFGALAGRTALRIDTTADEETRARYVEELLERWALRRSRVPSTSWRAARAAWRRSETTWKNSRSAGRRLPSKSSSAKH